MTFNELFKEYFYIGALCESENKLYNLICRYEDKVSQRLLKQKDELYIQGKIQFEENLSEMIKQPSVILKLIEKDSNWGKNLYHQPVIIDIKE